METRIPVTEIKARFSEYLAKVADNHERFIITKRNKPVAALINIEDLPKINAGNAQEGLYAAIGKWKNFEEIAENLDDIYKGRQNEKTAHQHSKL